MRVYEKPMIKVDANVEDDKVVLTSEGPLSTIAKPILKRINRIFQEEKPITFNDEEIIFSTWAPPIPSNAFNRMISSQIAAIMKKRVPDQFSIAITDRCPNNCIHCGAAGFLTEEELTTEQINSAIDQSLDLGAYLISFDGGETMLRKDLPEMVRAVDKDRCIATCFTSGFGLTPDRAVRLKDAGMYAMRISIDSPFEKEHDRIRGRDGAYRDAIDGIKNTMGADMLADMFVVISPDNIDDLEDFYGLAADMGMQEMSIYEIVAVGRWLEHEDEVITQKDVKTMERFQKRMNSGPDGPRVTSFPYFMGPDMFGCFAGRRWMHATPSGEVMPCAYTPLSFGNIKEEKLSSIWDNMGKHQAYRSNSDYCMMRNPEFRQKYIHTIPKDEILPYRVRNE